MRHGSRALFRFAATVAILFWMAGAVGAQRTTADPPLPDAVTVSGTVSPLLSYQARLTNPSTGQPVPDGVYSVSFRLYDAESSNSPLWTELKDVTVRGGTFSTVLGDTTALNRSFFNGQDLWLGIKVGTDAEAAPRQKLLPVPYALSLAPGATISGNSADPILWLQNNGGGRALQVSGQTRLEGDLTVTGPLIGGNHSHSGADITSGIVEEARIHVSIARDSEIMPTVLANDGTGSGLDADLLDGFHANAFAAAGHDHDARYYTESESDSRFVNDNANEVGNADVADGALSPAKIAGTAWTSGNDGAGSGLDADLLDGQHASAFAAASHTHTGATIVDGSIGTADLADGSVTSAKLASGVVPKFIDLNIYGAFLGGGATFSTGYGPYCGLKMPDSGTPSFAFGFTIPPDYTPGRTLTVRIIWHTSSTGCGIVLAPNFISIARAGRTHIQGGGVTSGFEAVGGTTLTAPSTANQSNAKNYTITCPVTNTTLQPGDSIIFGLYRSSSSASDTCTSELVIQSVSITY